MHGTLYAPRIICRAFTADTTSRCNQRAGIGRRLLTAAEDSARAAGRTLLLLDTESGSAGDLLYRSCGWIEIGRVPDHAFKTNGRLAETTMFYKRLDSRPIPGRSP